MSINNSDYNNNNNNYSTIDSMSEENKGQFAVGITNYAPKPMRVPEPVVEEAPPDKHLLVMWIMILLGAGLLLPYNVLITAVDYLDETYPGSNLEFLIPMVMNYPSPVVQVLMVKYGHQFSFTNRVVFWFTLESMLLLWIPFIPDVFPNVHSATIVILICIFIFGMATSILQSTLFGFGGLLPETYTQSLMSGNAIAGILVCACRILTKVSYTHYDHNTGLKKSSLVYFILAACITMLCSLGYLLMIRLPFTNHHLSQKSSPNLLTSPSLLSGREAASLSPPKVKRTHSDGDQPHPRGGRYSGALPKTLQAHYRNKYSAKFIKSPMQFSFRNLLQKTMGNEIKGPLFDKRVSRKAKEHRLHAEKQPLLKSMDYLSPPPSDSQISSDSPEFPSVDYKKLFKKIWIPAVSVTLVFVSTFIVFPGVVTELRSHSGIPSDWFAIILISQFNIFDLIGRTLPRWFHIFNSTNIWIPTLVRFALYPLFLMCYNGQIENDIYVYVFMTLFALSNGYLASVCMMLGPMCVESHEKEGSGYIMAMFLNLGILLGSHTALLMKKVGVGG